MKTLIDGFRSRCGLLMVMAMAASAYAAEPPSAETFEAGKDYELISPAQPTSDPGKVEVLEFFWYGCPHCFHFEPDLNAWLKTKPDNVVFIRQPAIFNDRWAAHAHAFFVAEALGVLDKMHPLLYEAIQNQHLKLESEEDQAEFFAKNGVAKEDFHKAYKSFSVDTKMRQAAGMAARYGVTGTPAVVINGKYRSGGAQAKSFPRLIEIMNSLIKQETPAKGAQKGTK